MTFTKAKVTLLTFESWVTKWSWYQYAHAHPEHVPHLLIDRSLCEEPFLDPFAPSPKVRQPVISGLCRCRKNFAPGDCFIYRTKIDPRVAAILQLDERLANYFAVASLRVVKVVDSHELASRCFSPRRYVVRPELTSYPPNLVHGEKPEAAVCRESCIVFEGGIKPDERRPLTPTESNEQDRIDTYAGYHNRMAEKRLRVALCRVETVGGREALCLDAAHASVINTSEFKAEFGNGLSISAELAAGLRSRIAASGMAVNAGRAA